MNNLIVTVIGIALTAIAALMGTYYGGSAFIEGQAKARANSIIVGAEQVANAWRVYAVDHGGDNTLTNTDWRFGSSDLTPKYLVQLPTFSYVTDESSHWGFTGRTFRPGAVGSDPVIRAIVLYDVPEKICKQINIVAKGQAYTPIYAYPGWPGFRGDEAAVTQDLTPFSCVAELSSYSFVYRVF